MFRYIHVSVSRITLIGYIGLKVDGFSSLFSLYIAVRRSVGFRVLISRFSSFVRGRSIIRCRVVY